MKAEIKKQPALCEFEVQAAFYAFKLCTVNIRAPRPFAVIVP